MRGYHIPDTLLVTEVNKKDKIFTIVDLAFKCGKTDKNMLTNNLILSNSLTTMKKIKHCCGEGIAQW